MARGSEPACLPASRLLENTRAKMNMLGAFLLGFVDEESEGRRALLMVTQLG